MGETNADGKYFAFLDALRDRGDVNTVMAPVELIREFPGLGADEAKAICAEWRATYHECRARLPRG